MAARLELLDPFGPGVEALWRGLQARARPSYFLTWGWIENWLASLPRPDAPRLAVLARDGAGDGGPAAAFFLGRRRLLRHHVLPSRARFLNATGSPRADELCIEHNGVLHPPGAPPTLAEVIALLPDDWDELFLPGVDAAAFADLADLATRPQPAYQLRVERDLPSPFVDLARVRATPGGYLACVAPNTRAQLRRARRLVGEAELEAAADVPQALAFYDELVALHARRWEAAGEAGAFADPWFDAFHRRLIARRFAHGEIQLLRLRAGGATLGCLYNLVADGRILFYQSGLAAHPDPHVKPGYLCHAAAIERAAADGHAVYDLLAGAARYKQSLATDAGRLWWAVVQRPRRRFALEARLRRWRAARRA